MEHEVQHSAWADQLFRVIAVFMWRPWMRTCSEVAVKEVSAPSFHTHSSSCHKPFPPLGGAVAKAKATLWFSCTSLTMITTHLWFLQPTHEKNIRIAQSYYVNQLCKSSLYISLLSFQKQQFRVSVLYWCQFQHQFHIYVWRQVLQTDILLSFFSPGSHSLSEMMIKRCEVKDRHRM